MGEKEYQAGLENLRRDWGKVFVDNNRPGYLIAANDFMTGMLVGHRAALIGEIINRALKEQV